MRSLWILSLSLFICFVGFSQNNQGEIHYEDKFNIHKSLPAEMEGMKENIPEFRVSNHILLFTNEEVLYKPKEKTEEEKTEEQEYRSNRRGGHMMRWARGSKSSNSVYTDIANNSTLSSEDLFGKMFLVNGTTKSFDWKVTGKQKQVGSYLCMEAVHSDSLQTIEVWFTPMIPVHAGPNSYAGLPGMILHVDINEGERLLTAIDVKLKALEEGSIVQPTEGKPINEEDFNALKKEKMDEMKAERSGNGKRIYMHH